MVSKPKNDPDYSAEQIKVLTDLDPAPRARRPDEVTCIRCGWVSYAVTKAEAEQNIAKFNEFYDAQPSEVQAMYAGRSSLEQYRCLRCGGTEFRPAEPGDAPKYVTLNPVIWEPDDNQE